MLRSMTGYGNAHGQAEGVEYSVEVRSVNNKYFKASIKLPENWGEAEPRIEKQIRTRLSRGSVSLTVRMKVSDEQAAYRVNTAALKQYVRQLKPLADEAGGAFHVDLAAVLLLPGATEPPPLDELCQKTLGRLMELVAQALEALVQMRQEEGKAVENDLRHHCQVIEQQLSVVSAEAPKVVEHYRQRLGARVAELAAAGRVEIDEQTLAREVAIFAERCDIAEEISRLIGHVAQFRQTLDADEAGGRKLEFLAQEMLREGNTIAAEANDAVIARAAVEVKTAVDRIKEQVQNVE